MALMTGDLDRPVRPRSNGLSGRSPLQLVGATNAGGAYTSYQGAILMADTSLAAGYFRPLQPTGTTAVVAGDVFGGVTAERQHVGSNNTADGVIKQSVIIEGDVAWPVGSFVVGDIGKVVYASDDQTLTLTSTNNLPIGVIANIDADYVWVNIDDYAGKAV